MARRRLPPWASEVRRQISDQRYGTHSVLIGIARILACARAGSSLYISQTAVQQVLVVQSSPAYVSLATLHAAMWSMHVRVCFAEDAISESVSRDRTRFAGGTFLDSAARSLCVQSQCKVKAAVKARMRSRSMCRALRRTGGASRLGSCNLQGSSPLGLLGLSHSRPLPLSSASCATP